MALRSDPKIKVQHRVQAVAHPDVLREVAQIQIIVGLQPVAISHGLEVSKFNWLRFASIFFNNVLQIAIA